MQQSRQVSGDDMQISNKREWNKQMIQTRNTSE